MPHRSPCARCDEETLLVFGHVLDVREVFPAGHCGRCKGRGQIRGLTPSGASAEWTGCLPCNGTGVVGEAVPPPGTRVVLVNKQGHAREAPVEDRMFGEAIHYRHRCR